MPVDQTQPARKRKESEALASCIKHTSFKMFPCSGCEKRNTKYVVSNKENSNRCSECVLCKVSCNVEGILIREWRSLEMEEDCLEQEPRLR
jgi:ferredoxin-like protein FixX